MGCKDSNSGISDGKEVLDKNTSYAIGMDFGISLIESMAADGIIPNIDEFLKGMKDGLKGAKTRFTLEEAHEIIRATSISLMEKRNAETKQEEIDFLTENARKPGVHMTNSGLQYEIITERSGPKPTVEDTVLVHYEAKFRDERFFGSSYTMGYPQEFGFYDEIPGLDEGLLLMSVGSKYKFYIGSELAYGEDGYVDMWSGETIIPPYATLIFEVELLEINPSNGGEQ